MFGFECLDIYNFGPIMKSQDEPWVGHLRCLIGQVVLIDRQKQTVTFRMEEPVYERP